jgi:spermidine synthase/MFS family permease
MLWKRPFLRVGLVVFIANAGLLVLQLVSQRMLAPYVGSSLETWTATIGVFLAGISLGNAVGGKLADRSPTGTTLARLLTIGAFCTVWMVLLTAFLGEDGSGTLEIPLLQRILLLNLLMGLPVSFVLSLLTPVAIRILLPTVGQTGRIVGLVYALGTIGSLVGNFLTGFVLLEQFQTTTIVWGTAAVLLMALPLCLLGEFNRPRPEPARPVVLETSTGTIVAKQATPGTTPVSVPVSTPDQPAAANPEKPADSLSLGTACLLVAACSFVTMSLELAASRLLAPYLGVSLYTWTGIIGVVLLGMAVGNQVGGFLADRKPSLMVLGGSLLIAGLAVLGTLVALGIVMHLGPFGHMEILPKVVCYSLSLFFLPMLMLGTISPQVTRLAVSAVSSAGSVAGFIYACSCVGAIAGTFVTGWLLISLLGVIKLFILAGFALLGLALLVTPSNRGTFWLYAVGILVGAGVGGLLTSGRIVQKLGVLETNYYAIGIEKEYLSYVASDGHEYYYRRPDAPEDDEDGGRIYLYHKMNLDHLTHSYVRLGDPTYLGYDHEIVQAEIAQLTLDRVKAKGQTPKFLVIGGGGYTLPRWISDQLQLPVDVVEIDPGVTQVAREYLGLDPQLFPHVNPIHQDGRQFVTMAPPESYDLVIQDAVNDYAVPYHILTKEYNDRVKRLLKPDGEYLLTVIDDFDNGKLMRTLVRTMKQTFKSVQVLATYEMWKYSSRTVIVIRGAEKDLDLNDLERVVLEQKRKIRTLDELREMLTPPGKEVPYQYKRRTLIMPADKLRDYVAQGKQIILTDRYAPVDQLMAPVFEANHRRQPVVEAEDEE